MTIAKAVARAWSDADYKSKLLSDPQGALGDVGVTIPEGKVVEVVEDTAHTQHLVLPQAPPLADTLDHDELEDIAGGMMSAFARGVVS